jgi:RHS repeat-associated protein
VNGGDEAMHRRYEGRWQRFAQPDPWDGSYDYTNPQSFNRYAYVQNDPVNSVDPSGLCTFNISIDNRAGLNDKQMTIITEEITSIFEAANQKVVFITPSNAGNVDRSLPTFKLHIYNAFPPNIQRQVNTVKNGDVLGYTPGAGEHGYISVNKIRESYGNLLATILALVIARIGAHEMGHYLLGPGHSESGLMRSGDQLDVQTDSPSDLDFSKRDMNVMSTYCPPELPRPETTPNRLIMPPFRISDPLRDNDFSAAWHWRVTSRYIDYSISPGFGSVTGYDIGSPIR